MNYKGKGISSYPYITYHQTNFFPLKKYIEIKCSFYSICLFMAKEICIIFTIVFFINRGKARNGIEKSKIICSVPNKFCFSTNNYANKLKNSSIFFKDTIIHGTEQFYQPHFKKNPSSNNKNY